MKELVDKNKVDEIKEYMLSVTGSNIILDSGKEVKILKGDVKVRKDEAILIYRYQIV